MSIFGEFGGMSIRSCREAYAWLRKLARSKFDEDCVEALAFNAKKVQKIQAQFREPEAPGSTAA